MHKIVSVAVALSLAPALGSADAQGTWRTYENSEWRYQLEYPAHVFTLWQDAPATGGAVATSPDQMARIVIFGGPNGWSDPIEQIADEVSTLEEIDRVTYRRVAGNWFVLSGYLQGDAALGAPMIFYRRVVFSRDRQHLAGFSLEYPESMRSIIDHTIARIGNSLRMR